MATIKIKLNVALKNHGSGSIIEIETDNEGTPIDIYWCRRLKDAEIDKCVEIVKEENTEVKDDDNSTT